MIRVSYVVDAPYVGGAERYVSALASSIDRARFKPSVVLRGPGSSEIESWALELSRAGVEVRRARMRLPFVVWDAVGIWRAIADLEPHVVHVNMPGPHDGQMGLAVPLARLAGAVGVVVTEHLPMVDPLPKRLAVKRVAYCWVDRVVTVSRSSLAPLMDKQRVRPDKAVAVANGVAESFARDRTPDRDRVRRAWRIGESVPVVVFVGTLERRKGLDRLIAAVAAVSHPDWRLVVVGGGPERGNWERLAEGLGVERRIVFAGRLTPDEVEGALAASDVFALPSDMEGMPYAVIEAMAVGLPVVATGVWGVTELVERGVTGLLVHPGDADALAGAIEKLVGDAPLRREMGAAGRRRFLERFTLDRQVRAMERIYERCARLPRTARSAVNRGKGSQA